MYCLFYKDHSSVYVQCAAANGSPNPAGADARLRMQEASRPKVFKRTDDIKQVNYMLYWVVSIFYIY